MNDDTTSADVTIVAKAVGEARPSGIAKHSTVTEPDIAVSSGEAGPSWRRAHDMNSAAATATAKSAGEARPPRIVKHRATTKPELAESSSGAGLRGAEQMETVPLLQQP